MAFLALRVVETACGGEEPPIAGGGRHSNKDIKITLYPLLNKERGGALCKHTCHDSTVVSHRRAKAICSIRRSARLPSLRRRKRRARVVRSIGTRLKRCPGRARAKPRSCWSASSPAIRKILPAGHSSGQPAAF